MTPVEQQLADHAAAILRLQAEVEALKGRVAELEGRPGGATGGPDPNATYSASEAGKFLGWSRVTVYTKVKAGLLPAVILPGSQRMRISGADILAVLARSRPAAR